MDREVTIVDTNKLSARVRRLAVEMTSKGGSSHIASVLSMADIVAVLYGKVLNVRPDQPKWPHRDRFILSKGHAGAGVYAVLAERGFFDTSRLRDHYANGSVFSGHISHKQVPGVELSTGSLGHGLGIGCGMAYSAKLKEMQHRIFVLLSEGDCDEGSNWEAIHFAGHHQLGHLIAIVDYNKIQSLQATEDTLGLEPFPDKWRSFRWEVTEVDGHDHGQLVQALSVQRSLNASPLCVIAHTTKGKGISFMENSVLWHYRTARGDELHEALRELEQASE